MTDDCIFCKIAAGDAPADVVYRDERITVFHDINPRAPIHVLIIPNWHVRDVTQAEPALVGELIQAATQVGEDLGIANEDRGYRLIVNYGAEGGLQVPHLHLHLLGGRALGPVA